jgi:hypothetical protein
MPWSDVWPRSRWAQVSPSTGCSPSPSTWAGRARSRSACSRSSCRWCLGFSFGARAGVLGASLPLLLLLPAELVRRQSDTTSSVSFTTETVYVLFVAVVLGFVAWFCGSIRDRYLSDAPLNDVGGGAAPRGVPSGRWLPPSDHRPNLRSWPRVLGAKTRDGDDRKEENLRRMQRVAVLWVVLLLMALVAAACGGEDEATESATSAAVSAVEEAGAEATGETTGTEAGGETTAAASGEPLKVGLVTDVGGLNDKGFNELANTGLQQAASELGATVEVRESKLDTDYVPNLQYTSPPRTTT